MTTQHRPPTTGRPTLTERYVHAATRRLPEEQRADVADELRGSIADRVDSLLAQRPGLAHDEAERAALQELGDPDAMAAGYTGRRLHLIGPELYPAYVRLVTVLVATVVPIATGVIAAIEVITGGDLGSVTGRAVWMALTLTVHIAFWTTLAFALAERGSGGDQLRRSLEVDWSPDALPELPGSPRGSLADLVAGLVFLALFALVIIWQQVSPPVRDGEERLPVLDPDLWSFWLPAVLVTLLAEMVFEVVKYRLGGWSVRLAAVNTLLGAVFAAPFVYLAAQDRLWNPAAVDALRAGWEGLDADVATRAVLVVAVAIWAWDTVDGWWKALRGSRAGCV